MKFKIGDVAVYPGKGVGRIDDINSRQIPGMDFPTEVYVVIFPSHATTKEEISSSLEVPVGGEAKKKLRGVMPLDQIEELQNILKIRDIEPSNQTWNRRYREYMAKIATGEPLQIAEVLRDLALLKLKKSLSFGERKMYDQAMDLLIEEWTHSLKAYQKESAAHSLDILRENITGIIDAIFLPDQEAAEALQTEKKNKKNAKKLAAAEKASKAKALAKAEAEAAKAEAAKAAMSPEMNAEATDNTAEATVE